MPKSPLDLKMLRLASLPESVLIYYHLSKIIASLAVVSSQLFDNHLILIQYFVQETKILSLF